MNTVAIVRVKPGQTLIFDGQHRPRPRNGGTHTHKVCSVIVRGGKVELTLEPALTCFRLTHTAFPAVIMYVD